MRAKEGCCDERSEELIKREIAKRLDDDTCTRAWCACTHYVCTRDIYKMVGIVDMAAENAIWIARDFVRCSGCRMCEVACSLYHENRVWPEASRVRVFMRVPGADFPHLCTQCRDYPCVASCPSDALSVSKKTSAVIVNREKCTSCMACIQACPGKIPFLHPGDNKAVICDLCDGDPHCARVCTEGGWNVLRVVDKVENTPNKLYARRPDDVVRDLVVLIFGERAKELI